jgi:prepilin-type N-terminal cleavage/methylation domain-containing protein
MGADRRGFTLVELILAMIAMLIVSGAVYQLLLTTQRLSRRQAEQLRLQSNVRGAVLAVVNELRELATLDGGGRGQNDILSIAPNAITYRAMRGTGFSCQAATATQLQISRNGFSGHRDPQAGRDSALAYVEAPLDSQPTWVPVAITSVSTAARCPGSMGEGITLGIPATASLAGTAAGAPVRLFELMELRLYQSGGESWLGMRSIGAGEAIQPLFGPLSDANGFRLQYLDGSGMPTSNITGIKSIMVTVRGVSNAGVEAEELTTQVTLRNVLH